MCVLTVWNLGHFNSLLDVEHLFSTQWQDMQTVATEELVVEETASALGAIATHVVDNERLHWMRSASTVGHDLGGEHELDWSMLGKVGLQLQRWAVHRDVANEDRVEGLQLLQHILLLLASFLLILVFFASLQLALESHRAEYERTIVLLDGNLLGGILLLLGGSREGGAGKCLLNGSSILVANDGSIIAVATVDEVDLSELLEVVVDLLFGDGLVQRSDIDRGLVVGNQSRSKMQSMDALALDHTAIQSLSGLGSLLFRFVEDTGIVGSILSILGHIVRNSLGDAATFRALLLHLLLVLNPLVGDVQQLDAIAIAEEQLGRTPDVQMLILVTLIQVMRIEAGFLQLLQNGGLVRILLQGNIAQRVEDQHGSWLDTGSLHLVPQLLFGHVLVVNNGNNDVTLDVTDGDEFQMHAEATIAEHGSILLGEGLGGGFLVLEQEQSDRVLAVMVNVYLLNFMTAEQIAQLLLGHIRRQVTDIELALVLWKTIKILTLEKSTNAKTITIQEIINAKINCHSFLPRTM